MLGYYHNLLGVYICYLRYAHMWIVQLFLVVYSEIVQCLVLHLGMQFFTDS